MSTEHHDLPQAIRAAIGPHTKAIIPVPYVGRDLRHGRVMAIAREAQPLRLEDCCQGVGGSYKGRKLGSIGHAGAFSFNYYKNISSGEGGGLATSDMKIAERARCAIDPCGYYWQGKIDSVRALRLATAPGLGADGRDAERAARSARRHDRRQDAGREEAHLDGTRHLSNLGLKATPLNSPEHECSTQVMYLLPNEEAAARISELQPSVIAGKRADTPTPSGTRCSRMKAPPIRRSTRSTFRRTRA